ncbi:MAG: hypothetical protein QOH97_1326 [Actinoplanes sp.]|nr:hypothetical protein [Actinoplanes sp.]
MSPTGAGESVRCGRRGTAFGRRERALSALIIRKGRIELSAPAGQVHVFAEGDYCYGIGPLALKVARVQWQRPVPHEGDTWFEVEGVVIDPSGHEGPRRQVLVRAGRLPAPPPRKRPRLRP